MKKWICEFIFELIRKYGNPTATYKGRKIVLEFTNQNNPDYEGSFSLKIELLTSQIFETKNKESRVLISRPVCETPDLMITDLEEAKTYTVFIEKNWARELSYKMINLIHPDDFDFEHFKKETEMEHSF